MNTQNKIKIVSFALFGITWILLIISFSSFWYYYTDDDHGGTRMLWTKFNEEKIVFVEGGNVVYSGISSWDSNIYEHRHNERSIYRASVSLVILSWICITVLILNIGLSFAGALNKISFPFNILIRVLSITAAVLSLVGMLVFTGLPAAKKKDCTNNNFDVCNFPDQNSFIYVSPNVRANPDVGWIVIIIAVTFNIGGSIISFFVDYQE